LALGEQIDQATEIERYQEGTRSEPNNLEGRGIRDVRTEFAQKKRSTNGHHDEANEHSSEDPC